MKTGDRTGAAAATRRGCWRRQGCGCWRGVPGARPSAIGSPPSPRVVHRHRGDPDRRDRLQRSHRQQARRRSRTSRRQHHRAVHHAGGHGGEGAGAARNRSPRCCAHRRPGRHLQPLAWRRAGDPAASSAGIGNDAAADRGPRCRRGRRRLRRYRARTRRCPGRAPRPARLYPTEPDRRTRREPQAAGEPEA